MRIERYIFPLNSIKKVERKVPVKKKDTDNNFEDRLNEAIERNKKTKSKGIVNKKDT